MTPLEAKTLAEKKYPIEENWTSGIKADMRKQREAFIAGLLYKSNDYEKEEERKKRIDTFNLWLSLGQNKIE